MDGADYWSRLQRDLPAVFPFLPEVFHLHLEIPDPLILNLFFFLSDKGALSVQLLEFFVLSFFDVWSFFLVPSLVPPSCTQTSSKKFQRKMLHLRPSEGEQLNLQTKTRKNQKKRKSLRMKPRPVRGAYTCCSSTPNYMLVVKRLKMGPTPYISPVFCNDSHPSHDD